MIRECVGWFWMQMHTCTSEAGNGLLAFLLLSNCIHRLQSQVIERVLFVRIIYYYLLGWTNELRNVSLETKILPSVRPSDKPILIVNNWLRKSHLD